HPASRSTAFPYTTLFRSPIELGRHIIYRNKKWRMTGSNRRPSACKADALPAELILRIKNCDERRITASASLVQSVTYALYAPSFSPSLPCSSCSSQFFKNWMSGALLRQIHVQLVHFKNGDPYGIRTRVTAVKGRCLNRLTKGPFLLLSRLEASNRA